MYAMMNQCPYCNKPGGTVKVVSDLGDGTSRRGRAGYRDQRPVTKFWHQECLDKFEEQNRASRERFLEESRQQMEDALVELGHSREDAAARSHAALAKS